MTAANRPGLLCRTVGMLYERPFGAIFVAAVILSANGLHHAAVVLARIPDVLAWLFLACVDLLAVAAFRTWRQAVEAGEQHWAGAVATGAVVLTVTMNALAAFPELAPAWVGPGIAAFPPIAALLAAALRMEEQRLARTFTPAAQGFTRDSASPAVPTTRVGDPLVHTRAAVMNRAQGSEEPSADPGVLNAKIHDPVREDMSPATVPALSDAARARGQLDRLLLAGRSLADRTLARSLADTAQVSLKTAQRTIRERRTRASP